MSKSTHTNNGYTKNSGFTLIELVIVIVVLGILAATAVPKFINLRADSKAENLESIRGSMLSALQLVHSQAQIKSQAIGDGEIEINGVKVPLYNGYPSVDGTDTFPELNAQVKAWLEIDIVDRDTANSDRSAAPFFSDKSTALNLISIFFTEDYDQKSGSFECRVRYENPVTKTPVAPVITVLTDSC